MFDTQWNAMPVLDIISPKAFEAVRSTCSVILHDRSVTDHGMLSTKSPVRDR